MQNLNSNESRESGNARRLSKSVAANKSSNLAEQIDTTTVTTNTNVVKVDYIEAEYEKRNQKGFDKRRGPGYNGSKASGKKKGGDDGDGGKKGGAGNKGDDDSPEAKMAKAGIKPGSQLTDE